MAYAYVVVTVWALLALLLWWISRGVVAVADPPPPPPPDPIAALVDKWAHDWERGRF